ncbi:ThuA domain-containing protein [Paenibacillus sp. DMB20]|uniref:ThuA domain-containing protein n=1 Tax=Paenibacillus sp. DMB20 TaxID=1642570 RepID=UPI000627A2FF|nr:ThuA domain-containing protein [Paenibacillus sp. DMB20]KKO54705.1 glycosyl hydrolase [Paenibacillus sp. DMB20]
MDKRKALLLGSYTHPKFHPLQGIDSQISHLLIDMFTVQCSENLKMLKESNLYPYDLCIAYSDLWDEKVSPQQTAGLLSYVSGGGGLLVLHNGITLANRYELAQLIGGRFNGHPPMEKLSFTPAAQGHDIMEGVEPFEMEEEPYRFIFDPFTDKTVLLQYEHEGQYWPAAWCHTYGIGRVVFLMPGHSEPSFLQAPFRRMIVQAAKWASRFPG